MSVQLGPGAEFDRIRRFLAAGPQPSIDGLLVGAGDDCAILDAGRIAIGTDLSIEDVHFRRAWLAPREIGARATAVALSDLAAVAARPLAVLASLAVARADADDIAEAIMSGLRETATLAGAALVGGDFTRSPGPIVLDVIVMGAVTQPVLRSGARAGEALYVTGVLGGAAAALADLLEGRRPDAGALQTWTAPQPRHAEAEWLVEHARPGAMIDLSDGLAGDGGHLAAASGVRVIVDATLLPIHDAARERGDAVALGLALGGGEDYELCFTAEPTRVEPIRDAFASRFGVPITRIGEVVQGSGVVLRDEEGRLRGMPTAGFDHFAGGGT